MSNTQSNEEKARDTAYWAQPVSKLRVSDVPAGALNLNVEGRQVVGALQGFGQMWQKTYKVRLSGVAVTPAEVITIWKENFAHFQPPENRFYPSMSGVKPGEIVFIDTLLPAVPGLPGMIPIASGVMVLYVDDESFTVMTPQGFPESGWNTFSAYEEGGSTVAQIQSLCRATDPVYEFGFRFMGGAQKQEETWHYVLKALAAHFDLKGEVQMVKTCVDPKLQWSQARNVWHNAGIRTMLHTPVRFLRKLVKG
jgi:hypothetical protein